MIYASESDIIPFLKGIVLGLRPYAQSNEIRLIFSSLLKQQLLRYQPFLLSQSVVHLVCNIISLLPPKSQIAFCLVLRPEKQDLQLTIENDSINLVRVNEICTLSEYKFTAEGLPHGTVYRLKLPLINKEISSYFPADSDRSAPPVPQFYKEIQKRFRSHFTQTEKLIAGLEQSRPEEAAFMQKINAVIKVNLEDDHFDTNALCKAMSLSRTQLFRRLKALIKQAPATHIKAMRLQKAKDLLETTDCTVSEISFKTGFQTISHFTKVFKIRYGISPSVYRNGSKPATNR